MPRPPNVKPLPERERRESLARFLDFLGRHPDLAHFRAAVPAGPEANLQALGAWSGRRLALELFATMFSHLNADAAKSLPAPATHCSPDPQGSAPFGDLIGAEIAEKPGDFAHSGGIIRHGGEAPGEQCSGPLASAEEQTAINGRGNLQFAFLNPQFAIRGFALLSVRDDWIAKCKLTIANCKVATNTRLEESH